MPSRAKAPFLRVVGKGKLWQERTLYQCPLGLMLHSYKLLTFSFTIVVKSYQCPLGLGLHFYTGYDRHGYDKNGYEYQCPFGLELHFYINMSTYMTAKQVEYQCPFGLELHFYKETCYENVEFKEVSMPFRAGTPFLL